MIGGLILALWGAFMVVAWPYCRHARHPRLPLAAAYLVFVTVVSMITGGTFFMTASLLFGFGFATDVAVFPPATLIALAATVPAILLGGRMIRRPPSRQPLPD
ncbi:hypothetical protein [Oceanibacterium hippocampi]|uniref:Uncharacterized protein n=1 Tax=Oceanibacterium hippocampi TaxID=745714 RepID=A0A1Y5TF86_9PROT|nr:hypothetical protein [Oceanibacterium hippocampi]SLN62493.1 hypothetical protein OCH7691_02767 [Oceanibacterium hippocampi]